MKGNGCVPIKLNLWTLKLVFHVIFMYHTILFFFGFFSSHLDMEGKKTNTFLAPRLYRNRSWARVALGHSLQTPGPESACISLPTRFSGSFNTRAVFSLHEPFHFQIRHHLPGLSAWITFLFPSQTSSLFFKTPPQCLFSGAPCLPPGSDLPTHTLSMNFISRSRL